MLPVSWLRCLEHKWSEVANIDGQRLDTSTGGAVKRVTEPISPIAYPVVVVDKLKASQGVVMINASRKSRYVCQWLTAVDSIIPGSVATDKQTLLPGRCCGLGRVLSAGRGLSRFLRGQESSRARSLSRLVVKN